MPIIINPAQFNPSALTAPGVYEVIIPPLAYVPGAPSSVCGLVGTASWGPLDSAQLIGDLTELNSTFGPISAAALTDIHDLATDVTMAFNQVPTGGLSLQCVRVSDGTDAQADLALVDNQGNVQTVGFTGSATEDDVITLIFTNADITGSPISIAHTMGMSDTLTTLATTLKNSINANAALAAAGITATYALISSVPTITVTSNDLNIVPVITDTLSMSATEIVTITAPSAVAGGTLKALYSGVLGNQIKISIAPGTNANVVNVTLAGWQGKSQEYYPNMPNNSTFWATFSSALSGGLGPTQAPSQLCRLTVAGGSPQAPQQLIGASLSGGLDGRSDIDSADLIGSPTVPSGIYALLGLTPTVQQAWIVGFSDDTSFPDLEAFAEQNAIFFLVTLPINTSVSSAVTTLQTVGVSNFEMGLILDWCQIFDPINNVYRYVAPLGIGGGLIASLAPQDSPLNQQVYGVLTTPRLQNNGSPYSLADVGLANTNGVMLISNPIGSGPSFGFITGVNTSLNVTSPVEYSRMTNFLAYSLEGVLGLYLGKNQSDSLSDPLRASVAATLNNFFNGLVNENQLDAYDVTCDTTNNPPATVAQHILRVDVQARYLASVWYLICTIQGGTTVQIQSAVIAPSPAS